MERHPNPTTFSGNRGGGYKKGNNSGRADHNESIVNKRHIKNTIPYRKLEINSKTKQQKGGN